MSTIRGPGVYPDRAKPRPVRIDRVSWGDEKMPVRLVIKDESGRTIWLEIEDRSVVVGLVEALRDAIEPSAYPCTAIIERDPRVRGV